MKYRFFFITTIVILLASCQIHSAPYNKAALNTKELPAVKEGNTVQTKYLAFQLFISTDSKTEGANFPPLQKGIEATVDDIIRKIGTVGSQNRKLGFIPGPLSFNNTDDQIRQLISNSFAIAIKKNIAVGFHIDDSMFWDRLSYLNKPENIEWLDWNETLNTGRRLDWSSIPKKIMPQLCLNSPAVRNEVRKRASVIGEEVKRGLATLKAAGNEYLFLGIIAGWETQIGRDFDTGRSLGYCALTNKGNSAKNLPANMDEARADIVKEFVDFWARSLANSGVQDTKIYSHIAFMPRAAYDVADSPSDAKNPKKTYLETINFTPPRVAFGQHHYPGFSTYPMSGHLDEIQAEWIRNGSIPWASVEGTAIDPADAEKNGKGMSMEAYLGNLYNHGAILVNVFGWAVGPPSNPFRGVAESAKSIEAYQKFLRGKELQEDPTLGGIASIGFISKIRKIQKELPLYVEKHGPRDVQALAVALEQHMKSAQYTEAEKNADEILEIIEK
ncbi:MAG: hypothetical protein ACYC27_16610 [Armatimonadota bacterium]